jgi:hypothetical protein
LDGAVGRGYRKTWFTGSGLSRWWRDLNEEVPDALAVIWDAFLKVYNTPLQGVRLGWRSTVKRHPATTRASAADDAQLTLRTGVIS